MVVDYRLLYLHCAIHDASFLFNIFFFGIATGNETGSTSDVLGASLDLCGTILFS